MIQNKYIWLKNLFVKLKLHISKSIILIIIILMVLVTTYSFLNPSSQINKFITYYNGISSLIIMLLTIAYVYTTNGQLSSMKKQLNIMDNSVNLQVQPLPVPCIEKIYLEKIRAYKGPDDNFSSIQIIYRFHCKASFVNAGNGAALNTSIYSSLMFNDNKDYEDEKNYATPDYGQVYCVSDKSFKKDLEFNIMILDKNYNILTSLLGNGLKLKMDIYYKNIFGAGFHEKAIYRLYLKDKTVANDWLKSLNEYKEQFSVDLKRHNALALTVPSDAHTIFEKVKTEINEKFKDDLEIKYYIDSKSFGIELINFDESILDEDKKFHKIRSEFFKQNGEDMKNSAFEEVAVVSES